MNKPCINVMCPYLGSEEQIKRAEDMQKKKHWITECDFKKYAGKGGDLFNKKYKDSHYVTADPSDSPLLF